MLDGDLSLLHGGIGCPIRADVSRATGSEHMPKRSPLQSRVERLEEKVGSLETKVDALAGLSNTLNAALPVFAGLSQSVQRLSERQTVLDNHVFGMLRQMDPKTALEMDPPLTDAEIHGGTA